MRFKVYPLRYRGRRLEWREVRNGPAYVGDLLSHSIEFGGVRYRVAALSGISSPSAAQLADLYEPVLVGFSALAFRLRGFERVARHESWIGGVQEWHCELP